MKAVVIDRPGGYETLRIVDRPEPTPGPTQFKVRVKAVGINYADIIIREGYYKAAKGKYPITPGFEFAGVIEERGSSAQGFELGDRVYGFTLFGGYASVQIVESQAVRKIPAAWSFEQAASIPAVHLTAFHGLANVAHAKAGEVVLVQSAAGGVGLALTQQSKLLGCKTIGVVSSVEKLKVAKDAGADHVILKGARMWNEIDAIAPNGFDIAFDSNGISTPKRSYKRLALGGRLVVYGFAEIFPRGKRPWLPMLAIRSLLVPSFTIRNMTSTNRAIMGLNVAFLADKKEMAAAAFDTIQEWICNGTIKPVPVTTFNFEDVAEAHKAIETGATAGKIILTL